MCCNVFAGILCMGLLVGFASCEKDFHIDLDKGVRELVVEAYINNEMPRFNYVVLTYSQDYYNTSWQSLPVAGAVVSITEGIIGDDRNYKWDLSTKKMLVEAHASLAPDVAVPGIYIDPMVFTDPAHALTGTIGKSYLLEIEIKGNKYSAITSLLQPVVLDSVTSGKHFIEDTFVKTLLTIFYKDPDTTGNSQLFYWQNNFNDRNSIGWGALGSNSFLPGTDDLINGQYLQLTPNNSFLVGDTVHYHLISVERDVYNFWDSYNKARNTAGPFVTPVKLASTIRGEHVTGCFSGFSLSTKTIITK